MSNYQAKGVRWDLSDLYKSPEDPEIEEDLASAEAKAIAFEKKYKPLLEKLPGGPGVDLSLLMKDFKAIVTLIAKIMSYANLFFAAKTDAPGSGSFYQKMKVRATDIENHFTFWEVLWCKLREDTAQKLMENPRVKPDLHFLLNQRKYAPYTLSEAEEKIMAQKLNTGSDAFTRLFDETINKIVFHIKLDGKKVKKTEGEILSLMHSPKRKVRSDAFQSLADGLKPDSHLLTYIYNMILADERMDLKLRHYKHPMDSRNLANETDLKTVNNLIQSVKSAYPLVRRFYRLKKKLLKLDTLYDYDRYAPIATSEEKIPFSRCKKIVLDGYYSFSDRAGKIIEKFFDNHWIDAEVREGKQGGAFSSETLPELHPYILVNYTGTLRDVMTLAHELGHGLHQYLARDAGVLESGAPLTLAETASVFGEMLIFEKIMAKEKNAGKRLGLLMGEIDDHFATVFRQIVLTDFELECAQTGIREGELSEKMFGDTWVKVNQEMYGSSVKLSENFRHGWKYIPHFIHSPFYCYAYAFAQLFVLSLYEKYRQDKAGFIPKYFEMLRLGGSRKPEEIADIIGLDLTDKYFWDSGLKLLEALVIQAEDLANAKHS